MSANWEPNALAPSCHACRKAFGLLVHRHHCRACGLQFCEHCAHRKLPLPSTAIARKPGEPMKTSDLVMNASKHVRVCLDCWNLHKDGFKPSVSDPPTIRLSTSPLPLLASPSAHRANNAEDEALPPGEYFQGPPAPQSPGPLPPFPGETALDREEMLGMYHMAKQVNQVTKAQQNDPSLSPQENAIRRAQQLVAVTGLNAGRDQLTETLQILQERHMPEGIEGGFVVEKSPAHGTLAHQHGLQQYDFVYGFEQELVTKETTSAEFASEMKRAFLEDGRFLLRIYSFKTRKYRKVIVVLPEGGNATTMLGVVSAKLPMAVTSTSGGGFGGGAPGLSAEGKNMEIYVQAWKRHGKSTYVSVGANAVPLYAPKTPENEDLYVKVARYVQGVWVQVGDYHPLYNYATLEEPLYVEVWRRVNGMLVRSGMEYAALPTERETVAAMTLAPSSPQQFSTSPVQFSPSPSNTVTIETSSLNAAAMASSGGKQDALST